MCVVCCLLSVMCRWVGHEFPTLTVLAVFGSFISYIYSAPPLKLKQSGWIGNYALGSSYIALPWWAGQVGAAFCLFDGCKHVVRQQCVECAFTVAASKHLDGLLGG